MNTLRIRHLHKFKNLTLIGVIFSILEQWKSLHKPHKRKSGKQDIKEVKELQKTGTRTFTILK